VESVIVRTPVGRYGTTVTPRRKHRVVGVAVPDPRRTHEVAETDGLSRRQSQFAVISLIPRGVDAGHEPHTCPVRLRHLAALTGNGPPRSYRVARGGPTWLKKLLGGSPGRARTAAGPENVTAAKHQTATRATRVITRGRVAGPMFPRLPPGRAVPAGLGAFSRWGSFCADCGKRPRGNRLRGAYQTDSSFGWHEGRCRTQDCHRL